MKKAVVKFRELLTTDQELKNDFETFCAVESYWLDDYALFMALKEVNKLHAWTEWDEKLRTRDEKSLKDARDKLKDGIRKIQAVHFRASMGQTA